MLSKREAEGVDNLKEIEEAKSTALGILIASKRGGRKRKVSFCYI